MEPVTPTPEEPSASEPTVLDWVHSLLKRKPIPLASAKSPPAEPSAMDAMVIGPGEGPAMSERPASEPMAVAGQEVQGHRPASPAIRIEVRLRAAHLRLPVALVLALLAQSGLENKPENLLPSLLMYGLALAVAGWAAWEGDLGFALPAGAERPAQVLRVRPVWLGLTLAFSILTLLFSSNNTFRSTTLVFWAAALLCVLASLWEGSLDIGGALRRVRAWLAVPRLSLALDAWGLAVGAAFVVGVWFRFWQLPAIPGEMVSDHAEKLLDVVDVLNGRYSIFFPRNTGREALQFYLAAFTARLLGTGVSFLTLKIGTALAGVIALPFVYLFARELGGRKVALAAMFLTGVAYWPNVISRIGLRFALYPLFAAPALYFLVRGLRLKRSNDLLWCGLIVGLGLHGYTPARAIPIAVAVGVILYALHPVARGRRWAAVSWLIGAGLVAFVVALPLVRYAIDDPQMVMFRSLTRIASAERELPGPAWQIFLSNTWNALKMFGWDDGEVWVNSIPHRPALDWISAALFHLGCLVLLVRYVRKRNWMDLFTLVSIPILLLPSILSLAFPSENPAPNRAGGALVPVFATAALPLAALPGWAERWWAGGRARRWGTIAAALLFAGVAILNYRLVFIQYADQFRRSAWNTSDMGGVIRGFAESVGAYDTAHVVAYPYWVDTRMPGIWAGRPTVDYAIWPEEIDPLVEETRAQLFIVKPEDEEGVARLRELFPQGVFTLFDSPQEGHDFLIFSVPARAGLEPPVARDPEP